MEIELISLDTIGHVVKWLENLLLESLLVKKVKATTQIFLSEEHFWTRS